jgi:hypothetical protein
MELCGRFARGPHDANSARFLADLIKAKGCLFKLRAADWETHVHPSFFSTHIGYRNVCCWKVEGRKIRVTYLGKRENAYS